MFNDEINGYFDINDAGKCNVCQNNYYLKYM